MIRELTTATLAFVAVVEQIVRATSSRVPSHSTSLLNRPAMFINFDSCSLHMHAVRTARPNKCAATCPTHSLHAHVAFAAKMYIKEM